MSARLYQLLSTLVPAFICDDWLWARHLPEEDQVEMLTELSEASRRYEINGDERLLRELVAAWATTARVLSNPEAREALLGSFDASDFVEVTRPPFTDS